MSLINCIIHISYIRHTEYLKITEKKIVAQDVKNIPLG